MATDLSMYNATATSFSDSDLLVQPTGFNIATTPYTIATHVPTIDFVLYPHPEGAYNWTHWGTGTVASTGKVYGAIGNMLGVNGNSYIYEYNPDTKVMQAVADLQSGTPGFQPTDWGTGKIHARIDEGIDGGIYASGWWGPTPGSSYVGDQVFKYDPVNKTIAGLGIPLAQAGAPSMRMSTTSMLLYAEEENPITKTTKFVAYDVTTKTTIFQGGHTGGRYARDMFVDLQGKAYFNNGSSGGRGVLQVYNPVTNSLSTFPATMPEADLRRATRADANTGVMYGLTKGNFKLFRLDPNKQTVDTLTTLWGGATGELADMDLDPTGRYIYYIPTKPYAMGVPLVQVDLQTMDSQNEPSQKIIAFLDAPIFDQFNIQIRGSWNLQVSADGRTVFAALTGHVGFVPPLAGDLDPNGWWDGTGFAAIHIPDGEAVFVPEPATLSLLALGGLAILRRRR
jgi:hypothetical protein